MAFGKNPKNFSKGRKGAKKKVYIYLLIIRGDRFLKKEWWEVKAPAIFENRYFTKTPVNVTAGKKLSSEALKGRVFEVNLGDLNSSKNSYKKIKLVVDDASELATRECLTNFYGLDTTRDHLCSLIRKWHTLIEQYVDAKTSDGFLMRFFCIAFTRKHKNQLKATTYAKRSHMRMIRRKMSDIISKEVCRLTLKELTGKLINETISTEIEKQCKPIYPIQNCIIRKVKSIKRPRVDSKVLFNNSYSIT